MFNVMVNSIVLYGVEVWGWREWIDIEGLQKRYIRWMLGLDKCTPGFKAREETKINQISIEARARAIKFKDEIKSTGN